MRRRKRAQEEDADIDLTPMLDVVFIMLIFFIVTTSFVKESGIDVNRPSASTAKKKERASILVAISQNGEIWIQNQTGFVLPAYANIYITGIAVQYLVAYWKLMGRNGNGGGST